MFLVSFVSSALTATKREASGGGDVTLGGDPAGTVRSWAIYLLDADGNVLDDPEIGQVLFDGKGNAALAGTRVSGVTVSGTDPVGSGWTGALSVDAQDAGTEAAYVGIVELSVDASDGAGAALATIPDLGILDLAVYATFQGLGLDAIVAVDRYRTRVEGDLEVEGVSVYTRGTIEADADPASSAGPSTRTATPPASSTGRPSTTSTRARSPWTAPGSTRSPRASRATRRRSSSPPAPAQAPPPARSASRRTRAGGPGGQTTF